MTKRPAQPPWKKKDGAQEKEDWHSWEGGAFGHMIRKEPNIVDKDVLLTNAIYGGTIPKDIEGRVSKKFNSELRVRVRVLALI